MTNTIPNVPRKLKPCPFCGGEADPKGWMSSDGAQGPACDSCGATANSADEWNARAPSPAGVDGLHPLKVWRADAEWDDDVLVVKLSDAQAIIDGLRGEVERLQRAEKNDAIAYKAALERQGELRAERDSFQRVGILAMERCDQHAQRIGELEGLLYEASGELRTDRHHGLRPRIDSALSAGKEGE